MVVETLVGIGKAASALNDTGKLVSTLERVKGWIMIQPEEASADVAAIVAEVMKAPDVVNEAVNKLLELVDQADPRLADLNRVGNGSLARQIDRKRPHCHDIMKIAEEHLSQWLDRPGAHGPDRDDLQEALRRLSFADEDVFYVFTEFAQAIERLARGAAKLAAQGKKAEALKVLVDAAPALFDAQEQANALADRLSRMQIEFRRRALGLSNSPAPRSR